MIGVVREAASPHLQGKADDGHRLEDAGAPYEPLDARCILRAMAKGAHNHHNLHVPGGCCNRVRCEGGDGKGNGS